MKEVAIKIKKISKEYRLGKIGASTLNAELQSWWAKRRGVEDPNSKLNQCNLGYKETILALDDISFDVYKGEALGIIGANGAGKSTLLKILSRITAPTKGDIWVDGRISGILEVGTGFHGELTGRENIFMNGAILGMSRKEVEDKIESIIEFSECRQFIDTPVKRYSSGMYVKLAFAVASHLDSEILVMDEVLAVGDMKFQKKCINRMGVAAEGEGKTVIYVSHNMATIRNLCNRCIVLDKGKVVYCGNVENAINLYMNLGMEHLSLYYNFADYERVNVDLGKKCFIDSVELINKKVARFSNKEELSLSVVWRAIEDLDNIKFGLSIKYADGSNVGFAEAAQIINRKDMGRHMSIINLELSNLADGIYIMYLQMFYIDEGLGVHGLDQTDKIFFEVVNDNGFEVNWQRQYWGSIRFNKFRILEVK